MPKTPKPKLLGVEMKRFSAVDWLIVVETLDAIARMTGKNGIKVHKAQGGWVIEQRQDSSTSDNSTGMNYTGEFDQLALGDPDDPYSEGDVVRISPTNDAASTSSAGGPSLPGVYVCVATPGEDDYPRNPLQDGGENPCWNWLATWPSEKTDCAEGGAVITSIADSQIKPDEGE